VSSKSSGKSSGNTSGKTGNTSSKTGNTSAKTSGNTSAKAKKNGATGPSEEMKAKFREALDRKQAHAGKDVSADGDPAKIGDAHGPARAQQMFRRKAGS
jgi:hypothetical protein